MFHLQLSSFINPSPKFVSLNISRSYDNDGDKVYFWSFQEVDHNGTGDRIVKPLSILMKNQANHDFVSFRLV